MSSASNGWRACIDHIIRPDSPCPVCEIERLTAKVEQMEKGLVAVQELIQSSDGVAGLHLNGDVASWNDLLAGGHFEEWLAAFSEALVEQKDTDHKHVWAEDGRGKYCVKASCPIYGDK